MIQAFNLVGVDFPLLCGETLGLQYQLLADEQNKFHTLSAYSKVSSS